MSDEDKTGNEEIGTIPSLQIDQYTGDVASDFGNLLSGRAELEPFLTGYAELEGFDRKLIDALWAQFVINTQMLRIVVDLLKGDTSAGASVGTKLVSTIQTQSTTIISLVARKSFGAKL